MLMVGLVYNSTLPGGLGAGARRFVTRSCSESREDDRCCGCDIFVENLRHTVRRVPGHQRFNLWVYDFKNNLNPIDALMIYTMNPHIPFGACGKPKNWATWWVLDGGDDADSLRAADVRGDLNSQVVEATAHFLSWDNFF